MPDTETDLILAAGAETQPGSRDETAFSIDPQTGQTLAPKGVVDAATVAMQALDRGDVDHEGYHEIVQADDLPKAAAAHLDEVAALKAEPAPVPAERGDENPAG